jgi:hypothetical protein
MGVRAGALRGDQRLGLPSVFQTDAFLYGFMTVENGDLFYAELIPPLMGRLRYLVSVSCGEQTIDDLKTEAWLAAHDICEEENVEFEPSDEAFQQAIFFRLMKKFGKYANREMRFAVRLDVEHTSHDGDPVVNSVARTLAAPRAYEPETVLVDAELHEEQNVRLSRYTEAIVYLGVLDLFDGDLGAIARHLMLSISTIRRRLSRAAVFAERQTSLFDGIEPVHDDFVPEQGRFRRIAYRYAKQWVWVCASRKPLQLCLFSSLPAVFAAV